MSYCSENRLPLNTKISRIKEVIELLGYRRIQNDLKSKELIGTYAWNGDDYSISFVQIYLSIFRRNDCITVETESSAGRSYWDLERQNKTISLIKSIFGGSFITTAGKNKYLDNLDKEPTLLESSLFVDRYIFKDSISKTKYYLYARQMDPQSALEERTNIDLIDNYNPRILSNNLLIPYIVGCWESFFRNSYISILKYSDAVQENALKRSNPSSKDLLMVIRKEESLENILFDHLSFQRPSIIDENFKQVNQEIKIAKWLMEPYNRRKKTLFDSITELVEVRNTIVHTGQIDLRFLDKFINQNIQDLLVAVDRVYEGFGKVYNFTPIVNYF